MEVYERETQEVIRRFLARRLSFPDCIAALDAALADMVPRLQEGQLAELRVGMWANNETVMREMEHRRATPMKAKAAMGVPASRRSISQPKRDSSVLRTNSSQGVEIQRTAGRKHDGFLAHLFGKQNIISSVISAYIFQPPQPMNNWFLRKNRPARYLRALWYRAFLLLYQDFWILRRPIAGFHWTSRFWITTRR
jgi:hypothetical protein